MSYKRIGADNISVLFNLYCSLVEQYKQNKVLGIQCRAEILERHIEELREVCLSKALFLLGDDCSEEQAQLINGKVNCYIRLIMIKVQDDCIIDVLHLLSQLRVNLERF